MKTIVTNIRKVIPYKMLLKTLSSTRELAERILPENGIPSLRLGLACLELVIKRYIKKAREDFPIIGYHFSFPVEYLQCFDCVPVCIEGTSYFLEALLKGGIENYYDMMLNWEHPFHSSSSQRGTMGMSLGDLFKFYAIITPTAPC